MFENHNSTEALQERNLRLAIMDSRIIHENTIEKERVQRLLETILNHN
jgi:hypothetical protein